MNIYIDEAGNFQPLPLGNPHKYSLVLALVVPSKAEAELFHAFLQLRDTWRHNPVEIKGSQLAEGQIANVMRLLASHGVIAEYVAIDMALHQRPVIEDFKMRLATEITRHLTDQHSPELVQEFRDQATAIKQMSDQLFTQAYMTMLFLVEMIGLAVNYYAQRRPEELETISWTIDRKDKTLTQMEQFWTTMILPYVESHTAVRSPFASVEGFDYSYFEKYLISEETADEGWKRHLEWMRQTYYPDDPHQTMDSINAGRLFKEQQTFADSKVNLGLQLADITASTLCRAFNDHLGRAGWKPAAEILIRRKEPPFIVFGEAARTQPTLEPRAAMIWKLLNANGQNMVI